MNLMYDKIFFFIFTIISSTLFCGNGNSKVKSQGSKTSQIVCEDPLKEYRFLIRAKIKTVLKTKSDINANHKIRISDLAGEYNEPLLAFAIKFIDVDCVKLLLENGANPDIEYLEKEITGFYDLQGKHIMVRPKILNFVTNKLCCKLDPHDLYEKYYKIMVLLVQSGADTSEWQYHDSEKILVELFLKLKNAFNQVDILIPPLKELVLEYLKPQVGIL